MAIDAATQVPSLVGSVMSCVATGIVLAFIAKHWSRRHSLRHVLIANLIFSEFTNSLNNSISGIDIMAAHGTVATPSAACVVNGYIGQLTVQATDFSVLAMAISTLILVSRSTVVGDSSTRTKIIVTFAIWTFPFVTSSTVAGLHAFGPVSGNWCWIIDSRNALRYGLAHGERIAIIIATIIIYGFIFRIIKKKTMFHSLSGGNTDPAGTRTLTTFRGHKEVAEKDIELSGLIAKSTLVTVSVDTNPASRASIVHPSEGEDHQALEAGLFTPHCSGANRAGKDEGGDAAVKAQNKQNMARLMLMRAYPFSYVILWIPGLANRFANLAGKNYEVLVILQASTQFIGFVDAILYFVQWRMFGRE